MAEEGTWMQGFPIISKTLRSKRSVGSKNCTFEGRRGHSHLGGKYLLSCWVDLCVWLSLPIILAHTCRNKYTHFVYVRFETPNCKACSQPFYNNSCWPKCCLLDSSAKRISQCSEQIRYLPHLFLNIFQTVDGITKKILFWIWYKKFRSLVDDHHHHCPDCCHKLVAVIQVSSHKNLLLDVV